MIPKDAIGFERKYFRLLSMVRQFHLGYVTKKQFREWVIHNPDNPSNIFELTPDETD
jgi:hypothetical protein